MQTKKSFRYKKADRLIGFFSWYHLESNQGHMDFQSIALPTELWYPLVLIYSKKKLWYHLESNQGHMDFQSIALPTELWYPLYLSDAKVRKKFTSPNKIKKNRKEF